MEKDKSEIKRVTVEYVKNYVDKWIPSDVLLPRAKEGEHRTEFLLGVYNGKEKQLIEKVYFDCDDDVWYTVNRVPPFELDVKYWRPFPKTPKEDGEIYTEI